MEKVFEYQNYKLYINDRISSMPKSGRGQYLKISKHLGVHSTLVSQILKGDKNFTMEQAYKVCGFFGFDAFETDYFMNLLHYEKAGNIELKQFYQNKLDQLIEQFGEVSSRVKAKKTLSQSDKAIYYSDWLYMAVWLLCGIDHFKQAEDIADYLNISLARTQEILHFLLSIGLVEIDVKNELKMGASQTHLERTNPLISRHHTNWRLKAVENFPKLKKEELAFSAPLTLSAKKFHKVKKEILKLIENISDTVSSSKAEQLACLNIDFFKI